MEFALIMRELTSRRLLLALGVLVATLAAVLSVYRLEGLKLKPRGLVHSSASTSVFVDTPSSSLANVSESFEGLQTRATVYANVMASPAFLDLVGRHAGIAGNRIYAAGPVGVNVPRVVQEPTEVKRNVEITGETAPYRFNFNNGPNLPTIEIAAQAPTTPVAIGLVNAAVASLKQYVASLASADHVSHGSSVVIRQMGEPTGGVVDAGIKKSVAGMVFIAVFVAWCVAMLLVRRFRVAWRATAAVSETMEHESGDAADTFQPAAGYDSAYRESDLAVHNRNGDSGQQLPGVVERAHLQASAN
jgi:hypothetical protein